MNDLEKSHDNGASREENQNGSMGQIPNLGGLQVLSSEISSVNLETRIETKHTADTGDQENQLHSPTPSDAKMSEQALEIAVIERQNNLEIPLVKKKYFNSIFALSVLMFFTGVILYMFPPEIITQDNVSELVQMWTSGVQTKTHIENWNVKRVVDMSFLFEEINLEDDISKWDVSKVTETRGMFLFSVFYNFDLGIWDVSNVKSMQMMFEGALLFNQDLSSWDVGKVREMGSMFHRAFQFNQDLSEWDVSQVTDFKDMFKDAKSFEQFFCWDTGTADVTNIIAGSLSSFCSEETY
uniref:BspA family leucine-rich repeat surface protein n=1 Tax=Corethron hystrix TaxID=216773 RepID=A0A7S1BYS6_9STRA|mmetsp:Transcript_7190/g.15605  ORF Transcript_7190/g.15605 Transcript_7190/m.15605 type:complete len:296 (+) Transcript_7190:111-998(+)|eukprot:CAMPEP_0113315860 /NCGR_PEP_ID=MMETSP0010_2-20120614/11358_1 /TAXON_ID=216773 ORGANISM="Corethron hystrix, Strain 308" /NCGR_SAMPLE_ID=MMETSP0010_2 /ASSEMBLY_ACC=CAM_ASM_000155 /LENGTH=295 /DNA_ID=CAMNT_0000172443 /DNA_START=15 /DNA_END=902 /DNA_ORIENTATION=+ /assembly_acc=CAM_ASM_000155